MSNAKTSNAIITMLAVIGSLVFLNLLSFKGFFRIDLTRDKKFTLSEASKNLVKNLDDVLTVKAYFTEGLPAPYSSHSRYVRDMLEEYHAASKGKFSFEFIDPSTEETIAEREKKKDIKRDIFGRLVRDPTSIERELNTLGIEPVEIRVIEDDQQQTKRAYLGISLRYQDKKEVIPVVQDIGNLEKELTGLMRKITRVKTPVVALLQTDVATKNLNAFKAQVAQNVTIKDMKPNDAAIGEDVDALMVVGNVSEIPASTVELIKGFVGQGKSATFLLDRFSIDLQNLQATENPADAPMYGYLSSLGINVNNDFVADVKCTSINMQEKRGDFVLARPVPYPFIPELMNVNAESSITRGLVGVMWPFASSLTVDDAKGLKANVLAKTSKESWLEHIPLDISPQREWGNAKIVTTGPHALMVSSERLLVAGTSAFLWDQFMNGPQFQANQVLALNIVDWMVSDQALLAVRARAFVDVPLADNISEATRLAVKFGNMFGVPLALILYGLVRWRKRENLRTKIAIN